MLRAAAPHRVLSTHLASSLLMWQNYVQLAFRFSNTLKVSYLFTCYNIKYLNTLKFQ